MSSLSHHGIKGQRWGVRRFQNKDGTRTAAGKRRNFENETSRVINKLSNEPKPIKRRPFDKDKVRQRGLLTKVEADQCAELAAGLYKNAEQVEPKITGDVIRVVSSTSAKMYGLEHRLKQPTSIAAKIGSDAKGDGVSFEEAASGIKDTIRYTAVSDSRDYVDTYNAIKQRLRDNGYEETKCKNYFQKYQNGEVLHKAVQSTFKSPDGIDFEFQFQTPESQAAKELKLPIYNERRKAGNTPERNAHLEQEMRNLAELVPDPEGVFSIQSHSEVKNIKHTSIGGTIYIEGNALILGDSSYLEHHGIKGQRWGVRRYQNKDGTLTAAGRKRKQHLIEVGSGKKKRLVEAAKPIGTSGDYSKDVAGLNRRGIHGQVVNEDDNTHIIKKGTSIYRTAANSELNDDGTYGSLTKNDVDRYIDYGRSGELPGADKSNLNSMKIFEFSANRDLKIANGKYITEIITDDVKHKMKNGDDDQVKLGKEILKSFKRYEEDLNLSFSTSEMRRSKEAYSRTEKEKEFDRDLVGKASDRLALYDKTILDYSSGKDYRVIRDRLKREGYDGFIDVEDVTTIENLVRGGANTEYPVVILNANDVLTLKRSVKESETQRRLKRGTKFNSSRGELTDVVQHTSIGGTMYIEGNALILGDSSYLEHHGIRGQRWGVRRFQNRDGSLTNAGRKRLGYATKGAAQTVGKAFKAGVKAGGNAVKAVKAHHEKKEAEKLQKKKEKASKTRLGVMANKDLFTNEEIRKLNERFKLEDEMKMATLQKGVEIAKAVGTIAQNVGTVVKTYEDVTGQSLSPIKRKAAEEKARQDKEDRERRIAREDADEARKAAKEERDIAIHEQTLRKAIASADTQEFTAQKTKAEADSSILDLYKKGQDFNGGSDATGQSWVEKAKNGGKNPFDDMIANRDPEYAQIRKEHDEKVARKERIAELERREKEREAEKAAAKKQSPPQQKQGGGDDDALFSQKGSLPIDKDRYRNNRAMEKAKQVKEDAAEERAKKQDEKAVNRTIDDTIEANRSFKETVRAQDPHAYDRGVAKDYIKGKLNNLPNALADLNPINRAAKKIADKATKEEEAQVRKSMKDQYDQMVKNNGRDEANYVMYNTRVANLQQQGYSERKAKQIADSDPTFSAKRNRKVEYSQKVKDLDDTHRKNAEEIRKANKELTDYYYKLVNGPGYDPGTPKREELDRKFRQKRGELERLDKDNNEMLEKGVKEAKKILEHSFTIQNGVLFVDSSDGFAHHGVKGQRWGVRRFQNEDGSLTEKGRKHYEKALAKEKRKQASSDAIRGTLERQHPFAVTGAAIMGAVAAGMSIAATGGASVAMIAAGSAISAAVSAGLTHATYSVSEAWEGRGTKRRQKKRKEYEEMLNHDGLMVLDRTLYLEHHGIRGQKWGVRRFQNPDGTLTAAGKKRDARRLQKELNSNDKKWAWESRYASDRKKDYETLDKWANKARSKGKIDKAEKYEKERDQVAKKREEHIKNAHALYDKNVELMKEVSKKGYSGTAKATQRSVNTGAEIVGMIALNILAAAAGSPVLVTRRKYVNGTKFKVKYNENSSATHYAIENGTLFINAGEPYLEHHGVKGMKWGKHLMAGKGEAGAGGGAGEDDEKLKEMAKKAGMSVAEFRTKMAGKLSGAASKVSIKDKHLVVNGSRSVGSRALAVGETGEKPKSFKEKAYNALGGKYKTQAAEAHREMVQKRNDADDKARRANAQGRAANANKKAGNVREYMANKEGARQLDKEAKGARVSQWEATEKANRAQWKYDHSIAGLYDKATGKYKQAHKRTKVPKTIDQAAYYYSEGPNSKLHNNGSSKAKTAKDKAKTSVWNAADHQIKAKEYRDEAADYGFNTNPYGAAYMNASAKEARLAEGSYRMAAALGKQASSETSTSSRPRARKKKHTSGGSGVTVRRPGRKPVSRTKRVTQSSTGVKRRGSTGSGRTVRRGA